MEASTEFHLRSVEWSFFGTLTWAPGKLGSVRSREADAWAFFRSWATFFGVKLFDLPIVLRWEKGEIGDRPHGHFLMKLPRYANLTTCFRFMHEWNEVLKRGFCRIRLYNPTSDGAYTAKGFDTLSFDASKANRYELAKFDYADRLDINEAAWALMCKAAGVKYFAQHRTT